MLFTYQGKAQVLPRSFKAPDGAVLPLRQQYEQGIITIEDLAGRGFTLYTVPTQEPLTTEQLLGQLRDECGQHIEQTLGWSDRIQRSAIAGLYSQLNRDAMLAAISLSLAECNRCEDLINAGLDYTAMWPVAADGALSWEEAKQL